jgi:PPOX class probable F420-dependent enzyme
MLDENARTLLDKPKQFATISTIEPDGRPQSSVVWFERDGDDLLVSTVEGRRKHRNLRARSHAARCWCTTRTSPYAYVEVRGHVEMTQRGRPRVDRPVRAVLPGLGPLSRRTTARTMCASVVRVVADKVVSRAIPAKKD